MSDHTVIAILVVVLAVLAGGLGYGLGEHRRHRDETDTYIHQLEDRVDANAQRLRAHGALIEVIAEDYDPPAETQAPPKQRRRKLPEGWSVIEGGGALVLLFGLSAWIRKHWRSFATAVAASGVTAVVAVALLAHGAAPAHRPQAGRSPSPPGTTQTAFTTAPRQTTRPSHTPRRVLAPPPVPPARRKPSTPTPVLTGTGAPPPPRPSPSHRPSPSRTPTPSPTSTCPIGVVVHLPGGGITICV